MSLKDVMAADQPSVFFNTDDFGMEVELDGVQVTALLTDQPEHRDDAPGVLVERKRLLVMPADLDWIPVVGMEITLNGLVYVIEELSGNIPPADNALAGPERWLPWNMLLVRYLS